MGRAANTPEVLWSKVDKRGPDECWPWLGFKNEQGYGRTWIADRGYYAHRVIFDLVNPGQISLAGPRAGSGDAGYVLHSCDNPCCCNPSHLSLGTHYDNMQDKKERGRTSSLMGPKSPRAKLTQEQAREIRWLAQCNLASGEIAAAFSVSRPVVKAIRSGLSYAEAV